MNKKNPYRFIFICMIVSSLICTFISYYSTGVVMRSDAKRIIDERLDTMTQILEKGYAKEEEIKNKICSNYGSRAKMTALMISQSTTSVSDENFLEEIRIAINADEINITGSDGIIEYSTSYNSGEQCEEEFTEYISDRNFTDVIIKNDAIIAGTARLDGAGIIQIKFSEESIEQYSWYFDVSDVTSDYPLLDNGCMAVIDIDSYTYLSHTDNSLIYKAVQIPADKFDGRKLNFYSYYNGNKVMVRYRLYNEKIILGMIPVSEIYSTRNAITAWVAIISLILSIVACLSFRKHLIDEEKCQSSFET